MQVCMQNKTAGRMKLHLVTVSSTSKSFVIWLHHTTTQLYLKNIVMNTMVTVLWLSLLKYQLATLHLRLKNIDTWGFILFSIQKKKPKKKYKKK